MQRRSKRLAAAELELKICTKLLHVCMQFLLHHTRKNALAAILHPLLFQFSSFCGISRHNLYALQSLFLQFSFIWSEKKQIQFNEWKFMHMETSNNSSNQSDFDKRFSFLITSSSFFLHRRVLFAHLSVSGFDGRKKIRDDVRLSKQLNKAEPSDDFSSSKLNCRQRDGKEKMSAEK